MLGFSIKNSSWLGHVIMAVAMMVTELRRYQVENKHNVNVFTCFHMQLQRDYHQVCHSLTVSCAVVKIVALAKCWFWREISQEVTKISKYFPCDILINTLTSDTIYRSNLKNWYSIYIAYRCETIFWPPRGQNIVTIYWPPLRYFDLPYSNQWQSFICLLYLLDRICHLISIILMNL